MPAKLRAFISSTMTDLENERYEVARCLEMFGIEPVNAEHFSPNGAKSWDVICSELAESHLFILLLGERYGWIPDAGPGAGGELAVTHMEYEFASKQNLKVLPFFKELPYNPNPRTVEEVKRDQFRNQVESWEKGYFRGRFKRAADLGTEVKKALGELLTSEYRNSLTARSASSAKQAVTAPAAADAPPRHDPDHLFPPLDPQELWALHQNPGVLVAGAGMSLSAGYPSANALSEVLVGRMGATGVGDVLARHRFTEIATTFEVMFGRDKLIGTVSTLLDLGQTVSPTRAHIESARAFPVIITTNYDTLFEQAFEEIGRPYRVVTSSDSAIPELGGDPVIFKIDGTISRPDTLVLSDVDAERAWSSNEFWNRITRVLQGHSVVVIGHSLRDINTRRIMDQRDRSKRGFYVSPSLDAIDKVNLDRFNLRGVRSDADSFMAAFNSRS